MSDQWRTDAHTMADLENRVDELWEAIEKIHKILEIPHPDDLEWWSDPLPGSWPIHFDEGKELWKIFTDIGIQSLEVKTNG